MIRSLEIRWIVAAALVVLLFYWFLGTRLSNKPAGALVEIDLPVKSSATSNSPQTDAPVQTSSEATEDATVEKGSPCITMGEFEFRHLANEHESRMDRAGINGPTITSYRNLTPDELKGLAVQGDSAAMAVLGAVSVMRSRNWPEEKAVSYLLNEEAEYQSFALHRPYSDEFIGHLEEARDWYYKAALHGRVLALSRVGLAEAILGRGPVELGWVTEEEYATLSPKERRKLNPASVYSTLPYELAPELRDGLMSSMIGQLYPRDAAQQDILKQLKADFQRKMEDQNLPRITVKSSNAPPLEELASSLCRGEQKPY